MEHALTHLEMSEKKSLFVSIFKYFFSGKCIHQTWCTLQKVFDSSEI